VARRASTDAVGDAVLTEALPLADPGYAATPTSLFTPRPLA
jgi:hypothetical protein